MKKETVLKIDKILKFIFPIPGIIYLTLILVFDICGGDLDMVLYILVILTVIPLAILVATAKVQSGLKKSKQRVIENIQEDENNGIY